MKEKIDFFMDLLPTITQEESDGILEILNWDADTQLAFRLAKITFEAEDD